MNGRWWLLASLLALASATLHAQREDQCNPLSRLQHEPGSKSDAGDLSPILAPAKPFQLTETDYLAHGRAALESPTAILLPVKSRRVNLDLDDVRVVGVLAGPQATTPTAAVLIIPGLTGLSKDVSRHAEVFAQHGGLALSVDLFGGRQPANRREAIDLVRQLNRSQTLAMLRAASQWLAEQSGHGKLNMGVAGYGLGAEWALAMAGQSPAPRGVALFAGGVTEDPQILAGIHCPLIGFFARQDGYLTPDRVKTFENALNKAGVKNQFFLYETAPGFAIQPKDVVAKRYAETAVERTLDFIRRQ